MITIENNDDHDNDDDDVDDSDDGHNSLLERCTDDDSGNLQ